MHCVSEYPTLKPNLNNIIASKKFKLEVGYSDHTPDVITPALSVIAGHLMLKNILHITKQN